MQAGKYLLRRGGGLKKLRELTGGLRWWVGVPVRTAYWQVGQLGKLASRGADRTRLRGGGGLGLHFRALQRSEPRLPTVFVHIHPGLAEKYGAFADSPESAVDIPKFLASEALSWSEWFGQACYINNRARQVVGK